MNQAGHATVSKSRSKSKPPVFVRRKCRCGGASRSGVPCPVCDKKNAAGAPSRLRIGPSDDRYEQQADDVADSITAVSAPGVLGGSAGQDSGLPVIQKSSLVNRADTGLAAPQIVYDVLDSPGQPLEKNVRQDMEARFGQDFGAVKIYNDARAGASAASIGARAYTVGQNIVFNSGEYTPSTLSGQKLLAHELTHTIQHGKTAGSNRVSRKGGTFGGFFRNIGRGIVDFFTGSEPGYDDDVLRNYLSVLKNTKEIEGDFDSDNKARAVVLRQLRFKPQLADIQIKVLLVEEMLDGPTLGDDEKAIINLLRTSTINESHRIVSKVGRNRLWDNFSGRNRRALEAITLTEADFKNKAEVERLKSLSPKKLGQYKDNAREPGVRAKIAKILQLQNITTPLDIDVDIDTAGVASFMSNGARVIVKPDIVSSDKKMGDKAHTQIATQASDIKDVEAIGNNISAFTGGETSFVIQTVYGPTATKAGPSKYGRGTTEPDRASGKTSLQFHESEHGRDFLNFIAGNAPPKFAGKVGMPVPDFEKAMDQYQKDINAYGKKIAEFSIRHTDCTGIPIEASGLQELGLVATFCTDPSKP